MQLQKLLFFIPTLLAVGVQAIALPVTPGAALAVRDVVSSPVVGGPIIPRCSGGSCGGSGSGISTIADVDLKLKSYTSLSLGYVQTVLKVYSQITTDIDVTVNWISTIGLSLYSWTTADLDILVAACGEFITHGTLFTESYIAIFTRLSIDIESFTVVRANCLRAFILTVIRANIDLTVAAKTDIIIFIRSAITVAHVTCADMVIKVNTCADMLVKVVAALKLDVKTATCLSAVVALKLSLKTYISTCLKSVSVLNVLLVLKLNLLLQIVTAWCTGLWSNLSVAASTLLGIKLSTSVDIVIFTNLCTYLLGLGGSFNFFAYLGLDTKVFTYLMA